MSFDVFLIPSSASPPKASFGREVRAAIVASGGHVPGEDDVMQAPDGTEFELYGGSMFSLRGLSPGVCQVIYRAAARTNAYIVPTDEDGAALKVKGTTGNPPKGLTPIKLVADPQTLCARLEHGFQSWSAYANHVRQAVNPPPGSPPH